MKKRCLFVLLALTMLLFPLNVNAESRASGNGWNSGTLTYNGNRNVSFTVSMARSGNELYDACQTDANIMRQHNAVTAYFNTYNYGYIYGYGAQNTSTTSGISYSNRASCPYGSGQVQSIISGSGRVIMYAASTVTSDVRVNY